ncbi:saccharopine dehydrogenase family protein [Kitasatospora sp. NPDC059599]|uniref:saccharopine dehydrogenase family protein n=1 Tax=Kitasatospora sp. NPDC059599 TaxID=3346880 RepID=UPI003699951F
MRYAVVGCGPMGAAAALRLAATEPDAELLLADRDPQRVEEVAARLRAAGATVRTLVGDTGDAGFQQAVADADAVAVALPWVAARPLLERLVACGSAAAGIGRPPDDALAGLGEAARRGRARLILPVGLEPGLTEILARRAVSRLRACEQLRIWCGGIPLDPRPPLNHLALYGDRLTITPRATWSVRGGALVRVPRFGGLESVRVAGLGTLEAYDDGMLPGLVDDPVLGRVPEVSQKTLRWPGYAQKVRAFAECGLLDEQPRTVHDTRVAPRAVLDDVLAEHVRRREGDVDVTLLHIRATGGGDEDFETATTTVVDRLDTDGLTSMARLTGFTLAACVRLLATGQPAGYGLHTPQEVFAGRHGDELLAQLRAAGVQVTEQVAAGRRPAEEVLHHFALTGPAPEHTGPEHTDQDHTRPGHTGPGHAGPGHAGPEHAGATRTGTTHHDPMETNA